MLFDIIIFTISHFPVLRIRDVLYRILHEKWNINLIFSCFLWFLKQSLSHSHTNSHKTRDPENSYLFQGGKKAPDPVSETLFKSV
jgi:hypothetical protein